MPAHRRLNQTSKGAIVKPSSLARALGTAVASGALLALLTAPAHAGPDAPAISSGSFLLAQAQWGSGDHPRARATAGAALADLQRAGRPAHVAAVEAWLQGHP